MQIVTTLAYDTNNKTVPVNISFDFYGNLYFELNDKSYQVNIDGQNRPVLDCGDYTIINTSNNITINKFNSIEASNILREKAKKTLEEDGESYDAYTENYDYAINKNLNNSDNEIIDEDIENQYGNHNKPFNFTNNNSIIPINMREFGDICALYNSYIYNGTDVCFISTSSNETSYYVIKVYTNGNIQFRPIGYSEKLYKLVLIDDNLTIQLV